MNAHAMSHDRSKFFKRPKVLLGISQRNWHSSVRPLRLWHRAGIEVTVIGPPHVMAMKSRYLKRKIPIQGDGVEAAKRITDKFHSLESCRALGLPVPEQVRVEDVESAREAMEKLGLPMILKPCRGASGWHVAKIDQPEDIDTYFASYHRAQHEPLVAQQFIEGTPGSINMVAHHEQCLAYVVGLKANVYPPPFGPSTCRKFVDHPRFDAIAHGIAKVTRYSGLCAGDFIWDNQGNPWLIELNLRPGPVISLDHVVGVDAAPALRCMMGLEEPNPTRPNPDIVASLPEYPLFPMELRRRLEQRRWGKALGLMLSGRGWQDVPWHDPKVAMIAASRLGLAFDSRDSPTCSQ